MNLANAAHGTAIQQPVFRPPESVSLSVFSSFDSIEAWKEEWDSFVAAQGANVYMTFDWCRIWWRFYGHGRDLRILVFRKQEQLAAIVPVFVENSWFGLVRLRLAKLLGADFSLQLCNPPIQCGFAAHVLDAAAKYLIETCKCDVISLSPLSGHLDGFEELKQASKQPLNNAHSTEERVIDCHSMFALPPSFDEYLKSLGKSQRSNYKRDFNLLSKSFTVSADTLLNPTEIDGEFESFRRLHTDQWNAEGRSGHFDDWPRAYEFNLELAKAQAQSGRTRLYRLLLNGAPVSYQYGFAFEKGLFWRLPARRSGPDWHRFGLGRMGLAKLIESAIGEGLTSIEGGQGHYDYKTQLGAVDHPVYSLSVLAAAPGIKARVRLAQIFSSSLNFAYYKMLFRRVYPRFPSLRRPLSSRWIRTRI